MKLPFKYIAILVIVSLAGIFAYQAYWLTGLYHTMHSEMERDITEAMRKAIDETNRRREKQLAYNEANGITPRQIRRSHTNILLENQEAKTGQGKKAKEYADMPDGLMMAADPIVEYMSKDKLKRSVDRTRKLMQEAARKLDFIEAAQYRDELIRLEEILKQKNG